MIQITCINKDSGNHYNPHESIEFFGWTEDKTNKIGKASLSKMVEWLEQGIEAYVQDVRGNKAYLTIRTSINGNKFVQTHSDGNWNNNLLALNECRI